MGIMLGFQPFLFPFFLDHFPILVVYIVCTASSVVVLFWFLVYFCSFNFALRVSFLSVQPLRAPVGT